MAIIGIVKVRKKNDIQQQTIKLTNFASALISMSLTQTALLSNQMNSDVSKYNSIGGIIFGILAMIVGIYMVVYTIKIKIREEKIIIKGN